MNGRDENANPMLEQDQIEVDKKTILMGWEKNK